MIRILKDSDPMPFGKYKGLDMDQVPADYLLFILEKGTLSPEVKLYIEDNLDVLEQEVNRRN